MGLPKPKKRFDVRQIMTGEAEPPFESRSNARNEDRIRSKTLTNATGLFDGQLGELLSEVTEAQDHLLSPVSAFHMREARIRLTAEAMRLAVEAAKNSEDIVAFTLVPPQWAFSKVELEQISVLDLKNQLRRWLERTKISKCSGLIYAGIHGEYDGNIFQIHFHGIATGEKGSNLIWLRGRFGLENSHRVPRTLKIVKVPIAKDLSDLARWATYCLQASWPFRPRFKTSEGEMRRTRKKKRLPAEEHAAFLRFMARHNVRELLFLNGLRLGKNGLRRT